VIRFALFPLLLLFLVNTAQAAEDDLIGKVVSVSDGDTFDLDLESKVVHIRLCGVDSPERNQPGYGRAAGFLADMIEGKLVHCIQVGQGTRCDGRSKPQSRNRIVAQCFIADKDVAMEMVRAKQACDWPRYSGGYYHVDEDTCVRRP